ncbi:MAG TPA: sensor histidine kinase, partial [Chloroflexi bacterium]|nr:sensor histidine kinase [Chloroflexota bacterium]
MRGAGLGLYMAKRLADLMHGKMTVETSPETGSQFTLHLPAS